MSLVRKTGANLLGFLVPMVIGFATFPVLVEQYGVERFGVITLMWVLVSYSGIVDMGLSRAIVLEVGAASGVGDHKRIYRAVAFAHGLAGIIGAALGLLLVAAASIAGSFGVIALEGPLLAECRAAAPLLAISLPFVAGSAVLRGELEGRQEFGWANLLRASTGAAIFLVPIGTGQTSSSLAAVALGFLLVRVVVWILSWSILRRLRGHRIGLWPATWQGNGRLVGLGGWLSVSFVVAPIMAYVDRFFLLSLAGAAALAAYATANEVVTKMWLVPTAATAVLLPEFSRRIAADENVLDLVIQAQRVILAIMAPALVAMVIFAPAILKAWLGEAFGAQVAPLLSVLCLGMIVSCLSQVPATVCLSLGAARGVALLQLTLVALLIPLLMLAVARWGAVGAAWVWVSRIVVDQVGVLSILGRRGADHALGRIRLETIMMSLGGAAFVGIAGLASMAVAVSGFAVVSLIAAVVLWRSLVTRRSNTEDES